MASSPDCQVPSRFTCRQSLAFSACCMRCLFVELLLTCAAEEGLAGEDGMDGANELDDDVSSDQRNAALTTQSISTACWLTMKEVAMLQGTLAQVIPLSGQQLPKRLSE